MKGSLGNSGGPRYALDAWARFELLGAPRGPCGDRTSAEDLHLNFTDTWTTLYLLKFLNKQQLLTLATNGKAMFHNTVTIGCGLLGVGLVLPSLVFLLFLSVIFSFSIFSIFISFYLLLYQKLYMVCKAKTEILFEFQTLANLNTASSTIWSGFSGNIGNFETYLFGYSYK